MKKAGKRTTHGRKAHETKAALDKIHEAKAALARMAEAIGSALSIFTSHSPAKAATKKGRSRQSTKRKAHRKAAGA